MDLTCLGGEEDRKAKVQLKGGNAHEANSRHTPEQKKKRIRRVKKRGAKKKRTRKQKKTAVTTTKAERARSAASS